MKATVSASEVRLGVDRAAVAAGTGVGSGAGIDDGPGDADGSAAGCRARKRATIPAIAEQTAPTHRAPVRPSSSMRMRPAARVPMIAPMVFAAYSRPNDWLRCAFVLRWRVRVGSVAPIRMVAGARARSAIARRMTARTCGAPSKATAISP